MSLPTDIKKTSKEAFTTWGVIVAILSVGISIGVFLNRIDEVEAKQSLLEQRVAAFSAVYDRLTKIETILDERLPPKRNER